MTFNHDSPKDSSCIITEVQPLLTELRFPLRVQVCGAQQAGRAVLDRYVHTVFKRAYGAELRTFYPQVLAFTDDSRICGVAGYRDGMTRPLFAEQYLDTAADALIAMHLRQGVQRRQLVEVGNLALTEAGEARWLIAAMTAFLHAAGYRWVVFTAVPALFNAFQRLGLRPIRLATPDPQRLPDGGRQWGRYYAARPVVCAGDITAGYQKLTGHISSRQPLLHTLIEDCRRLGWTQRGPAESAMDAAM